MLRCAGGAPSSRGRAQEIAGQHSARDAQETVLPKEACVELGMVGLGRMGSNMVRRLMRSGVRCVVHDRARDAVAALEREGATAAGTPAGFARALKPPRHVWLMVPAAVVDAALDEISQSLEPGDALIDGGNSFYQDDLARAARL